MSRSLPCVLFEDEHLLVVEKPAGLNTHAPAPFAGEGLYDWLRHREPRWGTLAIIHRLDKETSGLLVFAKTTLANRSLTEQFSTRSVRKRYLLMTDRSVAPSQFTVHSNLVRLGQRYLSRPGGTGVQAETRFSVLEQDQDGRTLVQAEPETGRTHQIRVHAADRGFPILGDLLYGGSAWRRLCLHAVELRFRHPATGAELRFNSKPEFHLDASTAIRDALFDPSLTNSYRLVHGAADGRPGWFVDRLGDYLLVASDRHEVSPDKADRETVEWWRKRYNLRGVYFKTLTSRSDQTALGRASPRLWFGETAPEEFEVLENELRFILSFKEGYSVGIFPDQRDNRRRVLTGHIAAGFELFRQHSEPAEVLNTFAYTCGFGVCGARAGVRTTNVDLSQKYLDWGKRNLQLNGLDPHDHDFLRGDAFDWMRRLARKGRKFDLVLLDPPTFSRSKQHGKFQAERDYGRLVAAAVALLRPEGVLFGSTNAATLRPEQFLAVIERAARDSGRIIGQQHYFPQPPDFPVTRDQPGYLKTVWMRLS